MFTHVDWAHTVMVLALAGKAERCLQEEAFIYFTKKETSLQGKTEKCFWMLRKRRRGFKLTACVCLVQAHVHLRSLWLSPFHQRALLLYQPPSTLSGREGGVTGYRGSQRGVVGKTAKQPPQTLPPPTHTHTHTQRRLWLDVPPPSFSRPAPLAFYHVFCFLFCFAFFRRSTQVSPLSLGNSDSWGPNDISLVHQAHPALINKHFESTPQHHTRT